MSKSGRYERKKEKKPLGWKKIVLIAVAVVLVLIVALVIAAVIYYNSLLDLVTDPKEQTYPTLSEEELDALLNPMGTEYIEETEPVETSPEDTWPVIESTENITNILLVGQASRAGEEAKLSDTMILCSINRETNTLTMVSFMRDMYVTLPPYAGKGYGANRINVAYALGCSWTGQNTGGMEFLELTIEHNFGIEVDHTVEVDFTAFEKIVDLLGGVEVELSEREAEYMNNLNDVDPVEVGYNLLTGNQALHYARMRKIDGDPQRTARQRNLITTLLNKMKSMNIMDIHELFTTVLPLVSTNMTNSEITNYAWEFIPMLKDLQIASMSIPAEGTYWSKNIGTEEVPSYALDYDNWSNKKLLHEALGLIDEE